MRVSTVWWTQARLDADGAESALRAARANADTIGASAKAEAGRPAEPMATAAIGTTSGGDDGGSEGGDGDGENEEAEENEDGDADSNDGDSNDGDGNDGDGDGDDGSDERADADQQPKRPTRASARHAARVSSNAALQQTLACCAACHCVRACCCCGCVCSALVVQKGNSVESSQMVPR